MKWVLAILFAIFAAGVLLQAAAASSKSDSAGVLGPDESVFFTPGTDAKKVEDKMAEALVKLDSWKKARAEKKSEPLVSEIEQAKLSRSPSVNLTMNNSTSSNSTLNNISINSSLSNSSLLNSSVAQVADVNEDRLKSNEVVSSDPAKFDANSLSGQQNVGSSSKGSLNGYYGMTASRHEMGKSGIDSSMFLSGNFEMDKTVKFQDQGID
jgi:hypothetical protein